MSYRVEKGSLVEGMGAADDVLRCLELDDKIWHAAHGLAALNAQMTTTLAWNDL